jgi:hypothetical protein
MASTRKTHYCFETFMSLKGFDPFDQSLMKAIVCLSPAWWLLRSGQTRSHPELGRQTLQRQWYYVSRPGRVGRRQACKRQTTNLPQHKINPKTAAQKSRLFAFNNNQTNPGLSHSSKSANTKAQTP